MPAYRQRRVIQMDRDPASDQLRQPYTSEMAPDRDRKLLQM
jgi:hypothetical protein